MQPRIHLSPPPRKERSPARRAAAAIAFSLKLGLDLGSPVSAQMTTLRIWSHQGQEAEHRALRDIAEAFNAAHADQKIRVELTFFPDFQYTERLAVAAAARDLPDAFDLDGPLVARFADAGLLAPLDAHFPPDDRADFLPTILAQGTIGGRLYAVGAFDSAVVLYYDRTLFARAGVTPPQPGQAWTWTEFVAACARLKEAGIEPVALHMNESADEWFTYAFSPVVWSGGGSLLADDGTSVRGALTSPATVRSLEAWQQLFQLGYAARAPVDPDPFGHGRTAMDWSGHWMARSHLERKREALGAMPLPVLHQPAAPCGSWCWGVSAHTRRQDAAARWVRWVTARETGVTPLVRANGAVPARRSAFDDFPEYRADPYALFRAQLESPAARPRPQTPQYATLTQRFAAALRDIAQGAPVAPRLLQAEDEIERVMARRRTHQAGKEP